MQSHEVIRQAVDRVGVKPLANKLRLSQALIYKWCQESARDDPDQSGARNPLDRLVDIVQVTGDRQVVNWLCHQADGFFVANPAPLQSDPETELLMSTQELLTQFSEMLSEVARSISNDGEIRCDEADSIRLHWNRLKSTAEAFVVACERGDYCVPPPT
jgi:hypothetical protein